MNTAKIVTVRLEELKPHPSYARHHIAVPASQMSALESLGDSAFMEPIVITPDRTVIDGYARWKLARLQGRVEILCIECDLTEEESLRRLIQSRRPSRGLNAYCRIILALDIEPYLRESARENLRSRSRSQGSSNLTEGSRIDVRSHIAADAGASAGNVTKVKQLRETACPALEQAVRDGEISIHRAWLWSYEIPDRQLENLRLHRLRKDVKRKARFLVAQNQAKVDGVLRDPRFFTVPEFSELVASLSANFAHNPSPFDTAIIATLDTVGSAIFITRDLLEAARKGMKVKRTDAKPSD